MPRGPGPDGGPAVIEPRPRQSAARAPASRRSDQALPHIRLAIAASSRPNLEYLNNREPIADRIVWLPPVNLETDTIPKGFRSAWVPAQAPRLRVSMKDNDAMGKFSLGPAPA